MPSAPRAKLPARILVVDDEPLIRGTLAELLEQEGYQVATASDAAGALELAAAAPFDLLLCDVQLPDQDGVTLLERILKLNPTTVSILITAYGAVETAVQAFRRGAHDYLLKPLHFDEVLAKIQNLLRLRRLMQDNQWLRRELNRQFDTRQIIGQSSAIRQALATVAKVAPTRSNVLIVGESGTGKELIARAIHDQSAHHDEKFIAFNCAAIPNDLMENQLFGHRKGAYTGADRDVEGLFVAVGAGTLFLDEVGEMSQATQAKLLRAIEQKEVLPVGASEPVRVAARILAATNKDLTKEIEAKRFREDLYYRLNVVSIYLPPLRERREDLPDLIDFLLAKQAQALGKRIEGIEPAAMQLLLAATWRGNVRELENALQRAVILGAGPLVTKADLPPDLCPAADVAPTEDLREAVAHFERQHMLRVLRASGDKKDAARRLGLALSSLYRKIEELGIPLDEARPAEAPAAAQTLR
jgi:DNA-binding NtrC family response regulator